MGMAVSTPGLTGQFGNPFIGVNNYDQQFQQTQLSGYGYQPQSQMAQLSPGGNQTDLPTQTQTNYNTLFTPNPADQKAAGVSYQMPEANTDGGQMYNMQSGSPVTTETLPIGLSGLQQQLSPVTQPAGFSGRGGYGGGNERFQTLASLAGGSPGTKSSATTQPVR